MVACGEKTLAKSSMLFYIHRMSSSEKQHIQALLAWQSDMGADEALDDSPARPSEEVPASSTKQTAEKPAATIVTPIATVSSPLEAAVTSRKLADACTSLDALREAISNFKELSICRTATNTVISDGQPDAEIMLIGEAPGANEDIQGIPFCGESGQLMDNLLRWVGLERSRNIYISNTVFWRPPGNRKPTPEELAVCRPFVEKHIALVKPKILLLIGGTATLSLLDTKTGITKLRGQYFDYTNPYLDEPIPATALFHPSYLLRSPMQKKSFWFDLLAIRQYAREHNIKM